MSLRITLVIKQIEIEIGKPWMLVFSKIRGNVTDPHTPIILDFGSSTLLKSTSPCLHRVPRLRTSRPSAFQQASVMLAAIRNLLLSCLQGSKMLWLSPALARLWIRYTPKKLSIFKPVPGAATSEQHQNNCSQGLQQNHKIPTPNSKKTCLRKNVCCNIFHTKTWIQAPHVSNFRLTISVKK